MKRVFQVSGYQPVNANVNGFMKAIDIGIDGVYTQFTHTVTSSLNKSGESKPMREKQRRAIKQAYEKLGCVEVYVVWRGDF